ncbi:MAG: type II toxin-antitoxin system VapC family toxin [Burkholderiales bacterium]
MGDESLIVLDTHVLVWWVSGVQRLSARAKRSIERAVKQGPIIVSTISVLEIATAVRRERLTLGVSLHAWLADLMTLPELAFEPVSVAIAEMAGAMGESVHGDPADRIIVATAQVLGAELVTADDRLRGTKEITTIW